MDERRKYPRINKAFVISYFDLSNPRQKHEITQLKNISIGGMCFVATHPVDPATKLGIELKTPYLASVTQLEGITLDSREKIKNMVYEVRLEFDSLSEQSKILLDRIIEIFMKEQEKSYE